MDAGTRIRSGRCVHDRLGTGPWRRDRADIGRGAAATVAVDDTAREAAVNEVLATARHDADSGQMDAAVARLRQFAPADRRVDDLRASLETLLAENGAIADEQAFVTRLDAAVRGRDLTTASSLASEALKRFPNAPAVVEGVRRLARVAQQETREARGAALPRQGTTLYADASRNESRAGQLMASAPLEAFRQYRKATDAFERAALQPTTTTETAAKTGTDTPPPLPKPGSDVPTPANPVVIIPPPPVDKGVDPPKPAGGSEVKPPAGSDTVNPATTGVGVGGSRADTASGRANAEVAKGEILQLVRAFEAAYSAMDENRLRQLQPAFTGIPRKDLIKSVRLTISDVQIRVNDDQTSANVIGTYNYQYDWRRSGFPPTSPAPLNWTVVKTGSVWRVR